MVNEIRTAHDGTIVSYGLLLNGADAIRHRRYMRKVHVPDNADEGVTSSTESSGEGRQPETVEPRRSNRRKVKVRA